jgi:hypothetical protein
MRLGPAAAFVVLSLTAPAAQATVRIRTLPTRADLISDGQALVRVTGARHFRARLGTRDVRRAFRPRPDGHVEGVVRGLEVGRNRLTVRTRHGGARLTITNHPNGGPVFSGPQIQPWKCEPAAKDAQCDRPATYRFLYRSTDPSKADLVPYDPKHPPGDVATTTTDTGKTVPFIVREEVGYQDRDQYVMLTLFAPGKPWTRWRPQPQFNHKLFIPGGGGCGAGYGASYAPLVDFSGTLPPTPGRASSYITALGRGFGVLSTALDNTGHNCNLATEAESLVMAKERFVENYGDVRYTIGTGCSGGSVVQMTVANAYPGGVYDGLIITCAFPDVLTAGAQFADYHLLRAYFEAPQHLALWPPAQWGLVYGRPDPVNAIFSDEVLFKGATNPVGTCVPPDEAYDPAKAPGGARCSILDYMINVLGPRPRRVWTDMERRAGRGFAGQPFATAGIQYGLGALRQGLITPAQFVDLNATVGGDDIDLRPMPARMPGDRRAVVNAYRTGLVNEMTHMSRVAIINHAGPDPGIAHDYARAWWIRDRLDRAQGNHDNDVLWFGPTPLIGDQSWPGEAVLAMDRWLAAVKQDRSRTPLARKIVSDRPKDVADRCTADLCESEAATRYGTPRQVSGGDERNDIVSCRLKPLTRDPVFSDAQWSQLEQAFPGGVCDWTKPGIGQRRNLAWLTYQDGSGRVIYGGRPMGPPPRSVPLR